MLEIIKISKNLQPIEQKLIIDLLLYEFEGKPIECTFRGRKFTSNTSAFEHVKREHVGKLSEKSYRYLISLGISAEKIIEFCKTNGVQIDAYIVHKKAQLSLEVFTWSRS